MRIEAVFLGKASVADDAEERPVTSVDPAMAVEVGGLSKTFVTDCAGIWFFTCKYKERESKEHVYYRQNQQQQKLSKMTHP